MIMKQVAGRSFIPQF